MTSLIGWTREAESPAVEAGDAAPAASAPVAARPRRRRWAIASGMAVCLVGCAVTAWVASHRPTSARRPATKAPATTTFADAAHHYRITYPRGWARTTGADGELVVHVRGQDAVSVRAFDLNTAVNTNNVADMRAVTDAILSAPNAHLTVLESQLVRVGGLTGLYYLYYFPAGAKQGVHAHYFLFSGKRMFTLVFQALPATDFQALATSFDSVAQSFAITPN
jgi:hypothetical protein